MKKEEQTQKDEKLLKLLKSGNRLAFNELYEHYWSDLFHYSYKILSSKQLAEDVVQDIFVKIWTQRSKLEISRLKSYLYNATRNASISKIRESQFSKIQLEVIENLSIEAKGETALYYEDLQKNLESAAAGLPDRCKEIFFLSRVRQYSIEEIANEFNISKRTVENQLSLALKHIRPHLTDVAILILISPFVLS